MRFNQESNPSNYTIRGYQNGEVSIQVPATVAHRDNSSSSLKLNTSFIMTPGHLQQDWQAQSISGLTQDLFTQILDLKSEIILLGTGPRLEFPATTLTIVALENGIGVECMDSSAACRTYNILMHEGRNVAAAIILESVS